MRSHIDLNCDLGEGVGIEAAILPYVSTINIACGAHAGDEALIRNTIQLAKEQQVAIGAHPSYPDRENFGRAVLPIAAEDLQRSVRQQIDLGWRCGLQVWLRLACPCGHLYRLPSADLVSAL